MIRKDQEDKGQLRSLFTLHSSTNKRRDLKEITFDPSYGSTVRVPHGPEEDRRVNSPSRGRSRDSQLI